MVGDPTGYAGPHPDIQQLACEAINQLHTINQMRQDAGDRWPQLPVALEDIAVRCQATWYGVVDGDEGADRGNYSVAIIDVDSGGRVASFMLEAVQPADGDGWKRYAMPGGIGRRESDDERESVMFFLGALMSVGGVARSERSASFRVEYAGGSTFESPFVDSYAIVLTPTISPAYPTEAADFSWIDNNGDVIDSAWVGTAGRVRPAGDR